MQVGDLVSVDEPQGVRRIKFPLYDDRRTAHEREETERPLRRMVTGTAQKGPPLRRYAERCEARSHLRVHTGRSSD